jgi:hypothetical protein
LELKTVLTWIQIEDKGTVIFLPFSKMKNAEAKMDANFCEHFWKRFASEFPKKY